MAQLAADDAPDGANSHAKRTMTTYVRYNTIKGRKL